MAVETDKLVIDVTVDASQASKDIDGLTTSMKGLGTESDNTDKSTDELNSSLEDTEKTSKKTAKSTDSMASSFQKASATITGINQALELAKKAYGAITAAVSTATDAYGIQEKAEIDLANAMKIRGDFTEAAFNDMKTFASELQSVSTVGDEATLGFLKLAKALGLSNEKSKEAVSAAIALSAANGKDLNSSFSLITRTLTGAVGRLAEAGEEFRGLTKEQLIAGDAIDIVNDKFGAFTSAARDAFSGKQIAAANAYGDVIEEIGQLFVDVFDLGESAERAEKFFVKIGNAIDDFRIKLLFVLDSVNFDKIIGPLTRIAQVIAVLVTPSLIAMVAPLALVAIKVVAIGASITALIVLMDLLVRNADQVGIVFEALGDAIAAGIFKAAEAFGGFIKFVIDKMGDLAIIMVQNGLINGDVGNAIISSLGSIRLSVVQAMDGLNGAAEDSANNMVASFGKLKDKGLLGGIVETVNEVKGALDELATSKGVEVIEKAAGAAAPSGGGGGGGGGKKAPVAAAVEEVAAEEDPFDIIGAFEVGASFMSSAFNSFSGILAGAGAMDPLGLTKASDGLLTAFENLPMFIEQLAQTFIDGIGIFVQEFPKAFEKILAMMPELIAKIAEAMITLIDALPAMFEQLAQALPGIIEKIMEALPAIIEAVFRAIPKIIASLMAAIPQIFAVLMEKLPEIIGALVEGLIGSMGEIIGAFIDTFITKGGAFKMAFAIIKSIVKLVPILISAIANGLKRAIGGLFGGGGIKMPKIDVEPFKKSVDKAVKDAGKGAKKVADEVFGLVDIGGKDGIADKGVPDSAVKAQEMALDTAEKQLNIWQKFLQALKDVWMWIWEKIFMPIIDALTAVFQMFVQALNIVIEIIGNVFREAAAALRFVFEFVEGMFNGIIAAFKVAFDSIMTLFKAVINLFKAAFQWIYDFLLEPIVTFFKRTFEWIFNNVLEPIVTAFRTMFDGITKALAAVAAPFKSLADALNNFSPPSIGDITGGGSGKGPITGIKGSPFNKGGPVQHFAAGGGVDTVPAMLTPGEFVLNRNAVSSIGIGNVSQMNQTGRASGGGGINIASGAIQINMVAGDSPQDVAERVIEEIKRQSLDGREVLFQGGIRA